MTKIPVIAVVGPTASGKTALAVELAKRFNGEIISADSMQIYKGMAIATAQPTKEEMGGIPHHLIAFADVSERFSVADYVKLARKEIEDISAKSKLPIIAGGTGLYIDSLFSIDFEETDSSDEIRERLEKEYDRIGGEAMLAKLNVIDEKSAQKLHPSDKKRIIRALEIYKLSGKRKSETDNLSKKTDLPYFPIYIGINFKKREKLYERINLRVDEMVKNGLLEEAEQFYNLDSKTTSSQAIGYKELSTYFKNEEKLETCIENLKKESRHYAKRQLTWFRRNEKIKWFYPDEYSKKEDFITNVLNYTNDLLKGEMENE